MPHRADHISPREALIKETRAKARRERTTFHEAVLSSDPRVERQLGGKVTNSAICSVTVVRRVTAPLGREGDAVINKQRKLVFSKGIWTSDGSEDFDESELFESFSSYPSRSKAPMTISFDDIPVRITKPKGIRYEYEFVERNPEVITLDDDDDAQSIVSDEDWENIYVEATPSPANTRRPYSLVVRGTG